MKTLTKFLSDSRGMTLAEVLVALGIIFAGLIALAAVVPTATGHVGESELTTTATFLAEQRLEQLKNASWTSTNDAMCGGNAACNDGVAAAPQWPDQAYATIVLNGTNYGRFRRTVRIATCSVVACGGMAIDPSLNTLRQITITVFFRPITGTGQFGANEETVTLAGLVAQRP
jgi:type II secretory pathway pseudopilin PulG